MSPPVRPMPTVGHNPPGLCRRGKRDGSQKRTASYQEEGLSARKDTMRQRNDLPLLIFCFLYPVSAQPLSDADGQADLPDLEKEVEG